MKKWTILFTALILTFALAACGSNGSKSSHSANNTKTLQSKQSNTSSATKKLQALQQQMQKQIENGKQDSGKTVAIVNGSPIKGKDYNFTYSSVVQQLYTSAEQQGQSVSQSQVATQAKQQTLDSLVGEELILQDAKTKGYKASNSKINSQYNSIVKQYGGKKKVEAALKAQDMTLSDLKNNIAKQIVYTNYVSKEIGTEKVTDKEIQQFYNQYTQGQKTPPKLKDVKSQIEQQLQQQKQNQDIIKIIDKLKKKGKVDVRI